MLTFNFSVFIKFTFIICSATFLHGLSCNCPCVGLSSLIVLFLFLVPVHYRLSRFTIDVSSLVYAHFTSVYIIPMYHHVIVTVITTTFTNPCLIKGVWGCFCYTNITNITMNLTDLPWILLIYHESYWFTMNLTDLPWILLIYHESDWITMNLTDLPRVWLN